MKSFIANIEAMTEDNRDFRRVLYTGSHLQLVVMSLSPGEEIGEEVHADHDQFFRIEKGRGEVWIDGRCTMIRHDDAVIVPAGARHNLINTGEKPMKVYTIYSPAVHQEGVVQRRKEDAELPMTVPEDDGRDIQNRRAILS
jgi:mannose-6-phosphate isomerase-like protein (cupin superfamily)